MTEPDLGELIFDDVDPALLMQRIVDEACSLVGGCDAAAIMRCHGDELITVSAAGASVEYVGQSIPLESSLSGLAIARGQLLHSDDVRCDERVTPQLRADLFARSLLSAPLRRGGEVIGVLIIISYEVGAFDAEVRANVARVASFAGIALAAVTDTARAVRSVFETLRREPPASLEPDDRRGNPARVGEFLANVIKPGSLEELRIRRRIATVLEQDRLRTVAQPVVELETGRVVGVEALARFADSPYRPPDEWFREAHEVGLGLELEALAVRRSLTMLGELPGGLTLGINVSHELLLSGQLERLLDGQPASRLLVELTEHAAFDDYASFRAAMAPLRERGVRLAVDDLGAGFSSLRHVVELAPDRIKLDRLFTSGIESDPARRAVAEALIVFARRTGIGLVAEGIESERELEVMRGLGVPLGQGFLIQRPAEPCSVPHFVKHVRGTAGSPAPVGDRPFARYSARVSRTLRRHGSRPVPGAATADPASASPVTLRS